MKVQTAMILISCLFAAACSENRAVQESGEHTVFLRVTAGRSGVGSGSAQRSVKRVASKEPPRGTLAAYQLTQDVTLAL